MIDVYEKKVFGCHMFMHLDCLAAVPQSLAMLICMWFYMRGTQYEAFPNLFDYRTTFSWSISWDWFSIEYVIANAVLETHDKVDFRLFSRTLQPKPIKSRPRTLPFPPSFPNYLL